MHGTEEGTEVREFDAHDESRLLDQRALGVTVFQHYTLLYALRGTLFLVPFC